MRYLYYDINRKQIKNKMYIILYFNKLTNTLIDINDKRDNNIIVYYQIDY